MDYQDRSKKRKIFAKIGLICLWSASASALAEDSSKFSLPLHCSGKTSCFLQNMVDLTPGPKMLDPFCGSATFNGHKGTDIRVRNIPEMKKGIPVLAMADGIVIATRDGVSDKLVRTRADRQAVNRKECGNGVVLRHLMPNGSDWTTQTCHLAKGSVRVKKGDRVARGQALALMGLSGATQFPHVHVSFRSNQQIVDPITATASGSDCKVKQAGAPTKSLFTDQANKTLLSLMTPIIDSGFSSTPVKGVDLTLGRIAQPKKTGPLVFYAKLINLRKGDQIRLSIDGPTGLFAQSTTEPLEKHKATYTAFSGKKGPPPEGEYVGKVELLRKGKTIYTGGRQSIRF